MDRKADIKRKLNILSAGDMVISFALTGNANGDPWRTIFVAYNGDAAPKTLTLPNPSLLWRQVVNAHRAGTETLAEIRSGAVTLPPVSMAVLYEE
jgi:pullulanase/glycogen debranching enzyme